MAIMFNPFFDISGLTLEELDTKHEELSRKLDTAYRANAHMQVRKANLFGQNLNSPKDTNLMKDD